MSASNNSGGKPELASEQGLDDGALANIVGGAGAPAANKQNDSTLDAAHAAAIQGPVGTGAPENHAPVPGAGHIPTGHPQPPIDPKDPDSSHSRHGTPTDVPVGGPSTHGPGPVLSSPGSDPKLHTIDTSPGQTIEMRNVSRSDADTHQPPGPPAYGPGPVSTGPGPSIIIDENRRPVGHDPDPPPDPNVTDVTVSPIPTPVAPPSDPGPATPFVPPPTTSAPVPHSGPQEAVWASVPGRHPL
jgi:hypothetical protein